MKKELIVRLHESFEEFVHNEEGVEYWFARDLQNLLAYTEWRNFVQVIEKAKTACVNAGVEVADHFVDINKMVEIGSDTTRAIPDLKLTRYACYLIAQNGDPKKDQIAFAQSYFAVQTRKQELIEQRLSELRRISERERLSTTEKRLAGIAFERGVDSAGFARIKSLGDKVLFGGLSTGRMKEKLGIPESRPLADFLPTVTITAKAFANALTEENVLGKDLGGERLISSEHEASNKAVRSAMVKRGIRPEKLPPAEDVKKVELRLKEERKRISPQGKGIERK